MSLFPSVSLLKPDILGRVVRLMWRTALSMPHRARCMKSHSWQRHRKCGQDYREDNTQDFQPQLDGHGLIVSGTELYTGSVRRTKIIKCHIWATIGRLLQIEDCDDQQQRSEKIASSSRLKLCKSLKGLANAQHGSNNFVDQNRHAGKK